MSIFRQINAGKAFKTQKANGLIATACVHEAMGEYSPAKLTHSDIHSAAVASAAQIVRAPKDALVELKYAFGFGDFPFFARPCPTVPRHGFVDSRPVVDLEDFLTMCGDAIAADEGAEIIVMSQLDGDASAILTENAVAIGPGNDGATSGHSVTLYGPVFGDKHYYKQLRATAMIAEGDVPYVEAVEHNNRWSLVQVRGGPEVPVCEDYIPAKLTVKKVLVATQAYDLLQWEKDVAAGSAIKGFVVDASSMSLTSHFAVHAVVNKVPVMTSRSPKVGDKIKPVGVDWKGADYTRLAEQINKVDYMLANPGTSTMIGNSSLAQLAIGALHLAGQPVPATDAQLRLTAFGVVAAIKLMSMACIGEARHLHGCSRGIRPSRYLGKDKTISVDKQRVAASLAIMQQMTKTVRSTGRDAYYDMAKRIPLSALGSIMYPVGLIFRDVNWDSAYGGDAWAGIVSGCRSMIRALQQFSKNPDAKTWARVVALWNEAIHREHNGGAPALSKFDARVQDMNKLAIAPLACVTALSLTDAWQLFGDPFDVLMGKIGADKIRPIHQPVDVPDGLEIPGERERPEEHRSILKGQIMLRGIYGASKLIFAVKKVDGYTNIADECHNFNIDGLFPRGTHDRIVELLKEYGGRLPASAGLTSSVKSTTATLSRRFVKHIKMVMFFAQIDKLELPATVSTSLNVLQLQVGIGIGFKSTVAKDAMKQWRKLAEPVFHDVDDDDAYDPDCDSNGERIDW